MKIDGVKVTGPMFRAYEEILTPEAIRFAAKLAKNFQARRDELLEKRQVNWAEIKAGKLPTFLQDQKSVDIRNSIWTVAPIRPDLEKRYVEITGPASSRKMFINALNSGADVYMTDSEDSEAPTWENIINGQINIKDAVDGTITYFDSKKNELKQLKDKTATLMFRPRGWHLSEKHVLVDGKPISASLFDFGLMIYHNAKKLIEKGKTPAFYLPKMESHEEAELWRDAFNFSEEELGIPHGTIRATVLIETILAAFEMDEILFGLKDYSAGLNAGRWDYLFSFIKKLSNNPEFVLPDRSQVTMDKQFLQSYVELLVQTCHKRGIHAMGGMSALIPRNDDPEANKIAIEKVRQDKMREVAQGCDGAWVAHPGLVTHVREIFEKGLNGRPHQIEKKREDVTVTGVDLLTVPKGDITEAGLRTNIKVSLGYLTPWLKGTGCVPINYLMEDLATVEISRSQVWQWLEHKTTMNDGRKVSWELVEKIFNEEVGKFVEEAGGKKPDLEVVQKAAELFKGVINSREFTEFLSLGAYDHITTINEEPKVETKEEFVNRLNAEWKKPRWEGIKRDYTAEDVWQARGTIHIEHTLAKMDSKLLWKMFNTKRGVRVLSFQHPHQAIMQVYAGLPAGYGSGWQLAAGSNTDGDMFTDQSLQSSDSMPWLIKQVKNMLLRKDRIHHQAGDKKINFRFPLVADMDAGYGGILKVRELASDLNEAGVAAKHIEDQIEIPGEKKCGHMDGKVLKPTKAHIKTLKTVRFVDDIDEVPSILIARTDALDAKYITYAIDPRDIPYIDLEKGQTEEGYYYLKKGVGLEMAIMRGLAYAEYVDMIWCETKTPDLEQARKFADGIHAKYPGKLLAYNCSPSFNWLAHFLGEEMKKFLPPKINDINMEDENLLEAIKIISTADSKWEKINYAEFNHKNKEVTQWVKQIGTLLDDETMNRLVTQAFQEIGSFQDKLNEMGYKFQFITLSGFHSQNQAMFDLATKYRDHGMKPYVDLQREQFKTNNPAVRHQEFVGLGYDDFFIQTITGSSTNVGLKGSTEAEQFKH